MTQKICYVMMGVSGAGKSTVTRKLLSLIPSLKTRSFSLDALRLDFYHVVRGNPYVEAGSDYAKAFQLVTENAEDRKEFDAYVTEWWNNTVKSSDILTIDNTNLTRKSRARWITEARSKGFMIVGVNVMVPLDVAIQRQTTRADKSVGASIVKDMYMRFQEGKVPEEFDFLIHANGQTGELFFQNDYLKKDGAGNTAIDVFKQLCDLRE